MVRAKQIPHGDAFVVKVAPGAAAEGRTSLAGLGAVEEIKGYGLLLLRLGTGAEPKAAWRRILDHAPSAEWAVPVLRDDRDQPHYPTSEVTVRFDYAPSALELEQFARAHGLRPRGRNEFVAEQVSFTLAEPRRTYLPELVQSLGAAEGVAAAWANTLSRYRRAEGRR